MRKRTVGELRPGDRAYSKVGYYGIVEMRYDGTKSISMHLIVPDGSLGSYATFPADTLTPETFRQYITRKDGWGKTPWWAAIGLHLFMLGWAVVGVVVLVNEEAPIFWGVFCLVMPALILWAMWRATVRNFYGKSA